MTERQKQNKAALLFTFVLIGAVSWGGLFSPVRAEEGEGELYIEWSPIRGAKGYEVQVRDANDRTILDKRTENNRLGFQLPAGNYSHRVGVLNKFNRISTWSGWRPMIVTTMTLPVPDMIEPVEAPVGAPEEAVTLKGKSIVEGTKVYLQSGDRMIPVKRMEQSPDGETKAIFDLQKASPGRYNMVLENPGGKVTTIDNVFKIRSSEEPPGDISRWLRAKDSTPTLSDESAAKKNEGLPPTNVDRLAMAAREDMEPIRLPGRQGSQATPEKPVKQEKVEKTPPVEPARGRGLAPGTGPIAQTAPLGFVPGMAPMMTGSVRRGSLWMAIFAGYAIAGYSEWNAANLAAASVQNDPFHRVLNDPVLYSTTGSRFAAIPFASLLGYASVQSWNAKHALYQIHNRNQGWIGGAAVVTYVSYLYLENRDAWSRETLVPGWTEMKNGHEIRGSLWLGLTVGAAVLSGMEWNNANRTAAAMASDPFYSLTQNPLAFQHIQASVPASTFNTLAAKSYSSSLEMKAKYNLYRENELLAGGTALVFYLIHLTDATVYSRRSPLAGALPSDPGGELRFAGAAPYLTYAGGAMGDTGRRERNGGLTLLFTF